MGRCQPDFRHFKFVVDGRGVATVSEELPNPDPNGVHESYQKEEWLSLRRTILTKRKEFRE